MAPKIPSVISCSSPELLEYEISTVRSGLELQETEDSWDKILNGLLRLNAVTVGSAEEYPSQIIAACKGFVRAILNSLNSERSRLSGCATDLLSNLAVHLGRPFETLIPLFVPTLLSLASRSNKIFVARAKSCLMTIIENCSSPVILPLLRHAISDKSVTLRLTAIDVVVACLNCFNPPDLEAPNRVEDIEAVIRATARDASADIRKSSRKAFEAYKILFPARVDAFVAPFTPTMKKYLNIKSAPANQRKPLLSSSASAPSVPSSSQPSDILARSHASVQGHGKSSSTSSTSTATSFTRVERTTKSTKPTITAPTAESVSMPPPPLPQKSSSGPVRPPPSMRQAIAAQSTAPTRPLFNRHASRIKLQASAPTVPDISKSQPLTHGSSERSEKVPSLSSSVHSNNTVQPLPRPVEADAVLKPRSTSGPRRVPKPDPVPVPTAVVPISSAAPAPSHKQVENLKESTKEKGKEKEREKATFASSAPSTTNTHAREPVFSRPPSRLAASAGNKVDEGEMEKAKEKERGKDRERRHRKRTESQAEGEFRPRPASRAEEEPRRRHDREERVRPASRMEGEVPLRPESRMERPARVEAEVQCRPTSRVERPASRVDGEALSRPESRMDKKTRARPESRAEMKAIKVKKTAVEQADVQPQLQQQAQAETVVDPDAQARREERRRRREERAAAEARAAAKRAKEEGPPREKASKKRRGEAVRDEMKPLNDVEAGAREHARPHNSAASRHETSENTGQELATTKEVEGQLQRSHQQGFVPENLVPAENQLPQKTKRNHRSRVNSESNDGNVLMATERGKTSSATAERSVQRNEGQQIREELPELKVSSKSSKPLKPDVGGRFGVRPLEIHKASGACLGSDVPLPPSPPGQSYEPKPFETPAPLRKAVASRRNQVPATPISKLMASIQRGFDPDFSMIGEEAEADLAVSCVPSEAPRATSAHNREGDANNNAAEDTKGAEEFFVDTRPRKLKSSHGKEKHGHNEGRAPLKAQNR